MSEKKPENVAAHLRSVYTEHWLRGRCRVCGRGLRWRTAFRLVPLTLCADCTASHYRRSCGSSPACCGGQRPYVKEDAWQTRLGS